MLPTLLTLFPSTHLDCQRSTVIYSLHMPACPLHACFPVYSTHFHTTSASLYVHLSIGAATISYSYSTLASAAGCETKKRGVYTEDFLSRTSNRDLSSLRSSKARYIRITNDSKSLETTISLEFVAAPAITTTLPLGSTTAASAEATCGSRQLRCSSGTRPAI